MKVNVLLDIDNLDELRTVLDKTSASYEIYRRCCVKDCTDIGYLPNATFEGEDKEEECLVWDASTALGDTIMEKYESFWLFLYNINKENKISGVYCSIEIASFIATNNTVSEAILMNFLNSNLLAKGFHRFKFNGEEIPAIVVPHLPPDTFFMSFKDIGLNQITAKCVF